ncbi:MAG: flagellar biosynthetic protein FliR [Leptospiraceae bacterium]|nr:flagellar biosynthetic protein FliR [Leptospiraceae bacterium]MCP5493355.1 flagellar biosynthetic protein FliR [Leptospiraceae bacterium]
MLEPFVYNFQTFMLIFARIMGLINTAPIYASEAVKLPLRVMIAFLTTLIIFPVTANYIPPIPSSMGEYFLLAISEIFVGVLIGFMVSIIFAGFQMAGEFFSVQMGFGYTQVLDPVSQSSLPVLSILKNMLGMLLFLVVGAHRILLESIVFSFERLQILKFTNEVNSGILHVLEYSVGAMFVVAFKLALPVMGIILLVTIAEALMGKVAPQLNILQISFPAKIAIGLIIMIITIPFIEKQMVESIELSFDQIHRMLGNWHHN